jgi:hypothetical protein
VRAESFGRQTVGGSSHGWALSGSRSGTKSGGRGRNGNKASRPQPIMALAAGLPQRSGLRGARVMAPGGRLRASACRTSD